VSQNSKQSIKLVDIDFMPDEEYSFNTGPRELSPILETRTPSDSEHRESVRIIHSAQPTHEDVRGSASQLLLRLASSSLRIKIPKPPKPRCPYIRYPIDSRSFLSHSPGK